MEMNYTSIIAILFSIILYSIFVVIIIEIAIAKEAIGYQAGHNTTFVASPNNRVANISYNNASSVDPQLATDANNIYIVWSDDGLGNADILFTKSTDGGKTFSKPVNLSNNIRGSFDPALAISKNDIFVAWDDDSPGNVDILFTKSTDRGNSFSIKPINLSRNVGGSLYPDVAISRSNNSYIGWSDDTPGNYEVFLLRNVQ